MAYSYYESTLIWYSYCSHMSTATVNVAGLLQESYWALGRGLGGSSNLNYMQYLRGSRHDYDDWANNGATGWGYKDVLPYFIKSEDQRNGEFIRTGTRNFFVGIPLTFGTGNAQRFCILYSDAVA